MSSNCVLAVVERVLRRRGGPWLLGRDLVPVLLPVQVRPGHLRRLLRRSRFVRSLLFVLQLSINSRRFRCIRRPVPFRAIHRLPLLEALLGALLGRCLRHFVRLVELARSFRP